MESISVFDMLKIGVGPSSSHTLGPWRAVQRWRREELIDLREVSRLQIALYGSLALTGKGHCSDIAIALALLGHDPETIDIATIDERVAALRQQRRIELPGGQTLAFDPLDDIVFCPGEQLPEHPNGMVCRAWHADGEQQSAYFSVGGGFVVARDEPATASATVRLPYAAQKPSELLAHCQQQNQGIAQIVRANELSWRSAADIDSQLARLWTVMADSIYRGCHEDGVLPGGLKVQRRAKRLAQRLLGDESYPDFASWQAAIRCRRAGFRDTLQWISCFALAVNEVNASLGRIVTAPTNGAAGVIPAVLMYHLCFADTEPGPRDIEDFLLIAGEIGTHFKKGATISAAAGGCQAEIGVSSAMAAAALTEVQGGSVKQALMAAEIAMEHHLGMTCDPVKGLVQIPCIERNAMGAIKAINAAQLALASDPENAKVSLDQVIKTMDQTAKDMNSKYKETSQGGLAVNIPVNLSEC